jgi:hypothetical protein
MNKIEKSFLTDLFISFVLAQAVLAGNDLDGAGGGAVATVGSGDDGVSIVDAATAEVESTSGLEGNLVGDGVWCHLISSNDSLIDWPAEVRIQLELEWKPGSTVELGLGHGHGEEADC